jgi:hypothetical protein
MAWRSANREIDAEHECDGREPHEDEEPDWPPRMRNDPRHYPGRRGPRIAPDTAAMMLCYCR